MTKNLYFSFFFYSTKWLSLTYIPFSCEIFNNEEQLNLLYFSADLSIEQIV